MELLQPLGLIALATTPLIVALYFLRQRRPPRQVGSLMLWKRAKTRVFRGRPWEKFRPGLLLLLQLMAALLIATAIARPACVVTGLEAERMVLILDASASMAARDMEPDRWTAAIAKARDTIQSAPSGSEIAILRAGHSTQVVAPFTQDYSALEQRLEQLEDQGPDATPGSVKEALLLALQLQGPKGGVGEPGTLILFSDGAFDASNLPQLGSRLTYVGVGSGSDNLALTTFNVRQALGQRFGTSVVATVTNTGAHTLEAHLDIRLDGTTLEAHNVRLEPDQARTFSLPVASDRGQLVATLKDIRDPDGGEARDLLLTDNVAYAALAPAEPVKLLLVGANPMVMRALQANPRFETHSIDPSDYVEASEYDVVIFEKTFPSTIPQGRFLAFAPPRDSPLLDFGDDTFSTAQVATWDRGHPALFHVDLGHVKFSNISRAVPTRSLIPLAEFGGESGPLLLAGQTPSWRGLVWTADLMESDFPLQVGFTVFLYNAVGWLSPGGEQTPGYTLSAGKPLMVTARSGDTLTITTPDDASKAPRTITVSDERSDGVYLFSNTAKPGFYTIAVGVPKSTQENSYTYGVSMANALESDITPQSKLSLAHGGQIPQQTEARHVKEWLTWLLFALLLLLTLEWWVHLNQNHAPMRWRERLTRLFRTKGGT